MDWEEFFAGGFYAIYCVLAFCGGAVGGVVVGTWATLACYLVPLGRIGRSATEGLDEPVAVFEPPPDSDPAVPDYWHGPARADLAYAGQLAAAHFRTGCDRWTGRIEEWSTPQPGAVRNSGAAPAFGFAAGLCVGVVPGAVLALALYVVQVVVVIAVMGGWRATGLALRGGDSVLLLARNVRMRCMACFRLMPYPAYRCPHCAETHWDVRPGPLGIARRTCRCGERFPTLLLLGSGRLAARCAFRRCGAELPHRPGTLPELVVPIFGAQGAGKTRLMYALVAALQEAARQRPAVSLEYPDEVSEQEFGDALAHLDPARSTVATPPPLQRGQTLRLQVGRRARFLQLFDAAGEVYASGTRSADLHYLASGRDFVLVVDPLSVPGFWTDVPLEEHERLGPLRPSATIPSPELIYQQISDQIQHMRGDPARSRLAVVFSRADQLGATGEGDIEDRARAMGLGGLVRSARLDFKEVRLFRTAAIATDGAVDRSIVDLLTWLLALPDAERARPAQAVGST